MAARSVGRGTHSVLTVKFKRSEPFGRPPLQWHMDCCKLQFHNVFWSRGPKDVGLLPSVRDALPAGASPQIPICRRHLPKKRSRTIRLRFGMHFTDSPGRPDTGEPSGQPGTQWRGQTAAGQDLSACGFSPAGTPGCCGGRTAFGRSRTHSGCFRRTC